MKLLISFSMIVLTAFLQGCGYGTSARFYPNQYSTRPVSTAYYDKMPSEGWATDPYYSYTMYSYWPYNTQFGGYGPHGPESLKRISI